LHKDIPDQSEACWECVESRELKGAGCDHPGKPPLCCILMGCHCQVQSRIQLHK